MTLIGNLKPKFWDHVEVNEGPHKYLFNFRSIWRITVFSGLAVALIPLLVMALIDYRVSRDSMESEILLRTSRLVSNARRTVSFFLAERKAAINFVAHSEPYELLVGSEYLNTLLGNLKKGFGGFVDLGVINSAGVQISYVGPYELEGKNYSASDWFLEVREKGVYISDVFMGYRNEPHMVIAVKHTLPENNFYVLRATIDTARFNDMLAGLEVGGEGDAFIINRNGKLQTPSRNHGKVMESMGLPIPEYSERSQVQQTPPATGNPLVIGYAYIPDTSFILMVVKHKNLLMQPWRESRNRVIGFLFVSVIVIIVVIFGGGTFLVNKIYESDQHRLMTMHEAEYANKMASLGRLSAGVAHEINNPLAIINEKAGLIKDIFIFKKTYAHDDKLMGLIDGIISSVERCAGITRRLLNFARHSDVSVKKIVLSDIIHDVLGFTGKESEYRSIGVNVRISDAVPPFVSDPGKLQEIFLNLITNAFAAMDDGGTLDIEVEPAGGDQVMVRISDTGHGIPEGDLERVFEPFFSTRIGKGGTGLGLSITYGLVQEIGGKIEVQSQVGEGTTFSLTIPFKGRNPEQTSEEETHENSAG